MKYTKEEKNNKPILIWDLPTRIFHWVLALSFTFAWLTYDDNRYLFAHVYAGYVFISLLLFRLVWGIIGSRYAQFRTFAYNWPSVQAYLKGLLTGQASRYIGHNPAGGWAIFVMLILGFIVSIAGILVLAGEEGHGPFKDYVPYAVGTFSKEIHEIFAWIMLAFTFIHVTGVVLESWFHKENLTLSMITGKKESASELPASKHRLLGSLLIIIISLSGLWYFKGYLLETEDQLFVPFQGIALPENEVWRTECGDCHLSYYPVLLPARSWEKLLETQENHFDEDLSLDQESILEIRTFLVTNSAESKLTEAARKINASTPKNKTPIEVTKTAYWLKKHNDINEEYWQSDLIKSKGNCEACHLDAKQGTFEDSGMRLPKLNKKK